MKIAFIVFFVFSISVSSQGQPLGDINRYLNDPEIPNVAKHYYEGKFKPGDDDSTTAIMDSLHTKNTTNRPFYLLLNSKMLSESDGIVSEGLFSDCEDFFERHPDAVIEFLYKSNKTVMPHYKKDWASVVIDHVTMSHEGEEKKYMKLLQKSVMTKCMSKNRKNLQLFFNEVNKEFHLV